MPYHLDDAPATNGFSAGTSFSNTQAYVGRHFGDYLFPARVEISGVKGAYVNYGGGRNETKEIEYLALPNGCSCSWMLPANATTHVGVIQMPDGLKKYYLGRVTLADGKVEIAQVDPVKMTAAFANSAGIEVLDVQTFDILVCKTTAPVGPLAVTYSSNAACHGWRTYKNDDAPKTEGFAAGLSWRNTTAWVGRYAWGNWPPGRIQIESPTGFYESSDDLLKTKAEFLVIPSGCFCSWVPSSESLLKNIALVPAGDTYFIGRVKFGNEMVAIAQTDDYFYGEFTHIDSKYFDNIIPEVLVCQKDSPLTVTFPTPLSLPPASRPSPASGCGEL